MKPHPSSPRLLVVGVALMLLARAGIGRGETALPTPAFTPSPSPSPSPLPSPSPSPTPGPGPTPVENTFVDQAYRGLYSIMNSQVSRFDQYFGTPDTQIMDQPHNPWVRVRGGFRVKDYAGFKFKSDFAASIPLPILENRFHAFLSNDNDIEGEYNSDYFESNDKEEDDRISAGLRYFIISTEEVNFNFSGGIKFRWPPIPYVKPQLRFSFPLDPIYCRTTQYVYWYADDGLGEKTDLELNFLPDPATLIQSDSTVTYSNTSSGVDLSQHFAIQKLDFSNLHGENFAVSLEADIDGHTWPSFKIETVELSLRFYHKIWRDWLRLGVSPGLVWERITPDADEHYDGVDYWRYAVPQIYVYLEILFDSTDELSKARFCNQD